MQVTIVAAQVSLLCCLARASVQSRPNGALHDGGRRPRATTSPTCNTPRRSSPGVAVPGGLAPVRQTPRSRLYTPTPSTSCDGGRTVSIGYGARRHYAAKLDHSILQAAVPRLCPATEAEPAILSARYSPRLTREREFLHAPLIRCLVRLRGQLP
jgi:hypothetical protein